MIRLAKRELGDKLFLITDAVTPQKKANISMNCGATIYYA
jgi:hypothetical protein